ncbi:ribonuclease E activity regulator RraA [Streptomyces sp. NPDC023723]|uniref:ribonuclease E activity regulator RraA n=1 Tax=Streptomyces sp. NPDC023723 TaxID=3154323 RepID=UPI0033C4B71B
MTHPEPTADLCDALGDTAVTCAVPLRHFGARRLFAGPVAMVRCLGDNVHLRAALSQPGHGRVLVVDGGGFLGCALLGDNMAELGASSGWTGIVVNGAVRDAERLRGTDLGVMALGTHPGRSAKEGTGSTGEPVTFGDATFRNGDLVYADLDGVVVLPPGARTGSAPTG